MIIDFTQPRVGILYNFNNTHIYLRVAVIASLMDSKVIFNTNDKKYGNKTVYGTQTLPAYILKTLHKVS